MAAADRARDVPVVIAGAGPASLVAAVTLARHRVGSLLVERNPALSPLPRATGVSLHTISSSTPRPAACSSPTAPGTGGCTAASGTPSGSGWRTTPTPA
jgi:cation diffusion facilitator CzcD-associated flavoprotein CzcO